MKKTLEYKILKFLSENNNGDFIKIDHLEDDSKKLKNSKNHLIKQKYIKEVLKPIMKGSSISYVDPKYKIEFSGIEYLKSFDEKPLTKYQKIYLPLFILFGLCSLFLGVLSFSLNKDNNSLKSDFESLKIQSKAYKDSLDILKKHIKNDKTNSIVNTSQTENLSDLQLESIPQGKSTYGLYFAEFDGRMENLPVDIIINGNKIIVYNNKKNPLTGGEIIIEGILLKHKSGKWIIGETETDRNVEEIGGCSGGPTPIDFETKIIEWC
tara:strand:+ start:57 stop:854 length:798 start_codon:yes stop_codon:yes gene_type:complete